jgi:hypothetical protein
LQKGTIYKELLKYNESKNILKNVLVIVDEAHKIFGKDLKVQEAHNVKNFQELIFSGYKYKNFKVILLTATPVDKKTFEVVLLLNLLIADPDERFIENENIFSREYLTDKKEFTKEGGNKFIKKIKGLVSYINYDKHPGYFPQIELNRISVEISPLTEKILAKKCKVKL